MGIPLPQPTSRTNDPRGMDDASAVASGTPVSSTRSDANHSAIRSYSRTLIPQQAFTFIENSLPGYGSRQISIK
jgi:hypothetical protein